MLRDVSKVEAHLSTMSLVIPLTSLPEVCSTYHLNAIRIGVVRQEVNRSAGRLGSCGSSSVELHAPSSIHCLQASPPLLLLPLLDAMACEQHCEHEEIKANIVMDG